MNAKATAASAKRYDNNFFIFVVCYIYNKVYLLDCLDIVEAANDELPRVVVALKNTRDVDSALWQRIAGEVSEVAGVDHRRGGILVEIDAYRA